MIDRDRHETFDEAVNLVRNVEKVEMITSYPCYEFWLLLHFGFSRKPYAASGENSPADMLIKDLRKNPLLANYDKGDNLNLFSLLKDKLPDARLHAPRVLAEALATEDMNPSTRFYMSLSTFLKSNLNYKQCMLGWTGSLPNALKQCDKSSPLPPGEG